MEFIPYGRQSINSNDKKLVLKSLEANLITTGSYVAEFEKKLKKYFGTKYTLACSSATAGLHMAFLSIDIIFPIKSGDETKYLGKFKFFVIFVST